MSSSGDSQKTGATTLVIENFHQMTELDQTNFRIGNKIIYFGLLPKIDIPRIQDANTFVYWWYSQSDKIIGTVQLQFKVSILNANSEKLYTLVHNWKFGTVTDYPIAKFILRASLLDSKNGYLTNGKLTLLCTAEIIEDKVETNSIQCNTFRMSEDYETLLKSGDYSDATFVNGEKEFRVHKAILAARSPVLGVMFKHEQTSEARSNRVDIIDVEVDVFEQLIRYIYTGKVEGLDRLAIELMAASDKYQVNSLKDICEKYLCSNLATETVANVLLMADLHRAVDLRSKCVDYITNRVRKVKETDGWTLLKTKPELLVEILLNMSDKYDTLA